MPSSGASSARHIVGADAFGEANDEEVRGSVDVVTMRRADSRRRKAEAIQAQLEKIKPLSKAPAPVPAAALAADLAALKRSGGIAGPRRPAKWLRTNVRSTSSSRSASSGLMRACTRRERRWWSSLLTAYTAHR